MNWLMALPTRSESPYALFGRIRLWPAVADAGVRADGQPAGELQRDQVQHQARMFVCLHSAALLLRLCFCCSLLEPRHRSVLQHDVISFLSFARRLTGWDDGIALHLSASMVAGLISTTATSPGGRLQGLVDFVAGFL